MGDLDLVTVIVIGINVLISMKGFNDYSFLKNINSIRGLCAVESRYVYCLLDFYT